MTIPIDFGPALDLNARYVEERKKMTQNLYGDTPIERFTTGREAVEALPTQIRVGPFDFTIQKWTPQQSSAANRFGELAVGEMRMSIQIDMPSAQKAADTFLHETGHAIFWAYGIEDTDKEERLVSTLATTWLQVFRDNPFILPWLQRCC